MTDRFSLIRARPRLDLPAALTTAVLWICGTFEIVLIIGVLWLVAYSMPWK